MGLDTELGKVDVRKIRRQANTDNYAISRSSGLVVIELPPNDLIIGLHGRVETIKVVGFIQRA